MLYCHKIEHFCKSKAAEAIRSQSPTTRTFYIDSCCQCFISASMIDDLDFLCFRIGHTANVKH